MRPGRARGCRGRSSRRATIRRRRDGRVRSVAGGCDRGDGDRACGWGRRRRTGVCARVRDAAPRGARARARLRAMPVRADSSAPRHGCRQAHGCVPRTRRGRWRRARRAASRARPASGRNSRRRGSRVVACARWHDGRRRCWATAPSLRRHGPASARGTPVRRRRPRRCRSPACRPCRGCRPKFHCLVLALRSGILLVDAARRAARACRRRIARPMAVAALAGVRPSSPPAPLAGMARWSHCRVEGPDRRPPT